MLFLTNDPILYYLMSGNAGPLMFLLLMALFVGIIVTIAVKIPQRHRRGKYFNAIFGACILLSIVGAFYIAGNYF